MKPKPVVVTTICSECGLAWEAHGKNPTTADCIRLLKIELAKRPKTTVTYYPLYPYVAPYQFYPAQYTYGNTTTLTTTTGTSGNVQGYNSNTLGDGHTLTVNTPATSTITCSAISA